MSFSLRGVITSVAVVCVGAVVVLTVSRRRRKRQAPGDQAIADAAVADLPFIETALKFKSGTHVLVAAGGDKPVLEPVRVYDARPAPSRFTLDAHGFELATDVPPHGLSAADIYEAPERVLSELYPKMEAMLLARCPGATRVLIFDHLLRNRVRLNAEMDEARAACECQAKQHAQKSLAAELARPEPVPTARAQSDGTHQQQHKLPVAERIRSAPAELPPVAKRELSSCHQDEARCMLEECLATAQPRTRFLEMPLGHVHGDYTVRSGHTRARQLLAPYCSAADIEAALSHRFAVVNIWHSIGAEPVAADPLCMCVWGSFKPHDLMTKRLTFPHRIGETYQASAAPSHRWVHFSAMTRDEAILLKTFDSRDDGATALFSIHSAFRMPAQDEPHAAAALPTRESIELRCLVLYGDGLEDFATGFVNPSLAGPDAPAAAREQAKLTELELYNLVSSELLPASDAW